MFNVLKSCQTVFQSHRTILPSHQQRRRVRCCCSFNYNHSGGCVAVSPGDFNWHSLMTNDVENFFLCLLAICIYSCVKCLSKLFLLNYLSFCYQVRILYVCWMQALCQIWVLPKFFSSCGLPIYFLTDIF